MAALPGKFARFSTPSGTQLVGAYRWNISFKREGLDTTNFESAIDASGLNACSDGLTGVLDTTFQVELYPNDQNPNVFWPLATLACDLLFRKNQPLGYVGIMADVLDFSPSTSVREVSKGTAQLQSNGIVPQAAA